MNELNQQATATGAQSSYISPEDDKQNAWLPVVMKTLHMYLANWKWFLVSVAVCMLLAYLYQARQPRVFERSSTIAVKSSDDNRSSRNASSQMALTGVGTNGGLKDATFVLKSHRLMRQVVKVLGLDVDYTVDVGLRDYSLYKESPVKVTFFKPFSQAVSFDVELESSDSYHIHNMLLNGGDTGMDITAPLRQGNRHPRGSDTD